MVRQLAVGVGVWFSLGAAMAAPTIQVAPSSPVPTQDGTVKLQWSASEAKSSTCQVQMAAPTSGEAYELWYEGPATESFVSGLSNGTARFRVRCAFVEAGNSATTWGPWSEVLEVEVVHHGMAKALGLLGLGAAVFVSIVVYIVVGALRTREEQQ